MEMYKATIYIEYEGKLEKITKCFANTDDRNNWIAEKLLSSKFHCLIITGEEITFS